MHQFIKDAVKGGWLETLSQKDKLEVETIILLDPKAWEAVGKIRGWKSDNDSYYDYIAYQERMHTFLDHLIDGLSIEKALNKIK